jgi:hypothetical protein
LFLFVCFFFFLIKQKKKKKKKKTASPICHASRVRAATLVLLGDSDLRVPMSQGRLWAQAVQASTSTPPPGFCVVFFLFDLGFIDLHL